MSDGPFVFIAVACADCGRVTMQSDRVPSMVTVGRAEHFAREAGYYKAETDHRWYCGKCFPEPDGDDADPPPPGRPVEDPPTF